MTDDSRYGIGTWSFSSRTDIGTCRETRSASTETSDIAGRSSLLEERIPNILRDVSDGTDMRHLARVADKLVSISERGGGGTDSSRWSQMSK